MNNATPLKILHWNANGIFQKQQELLALITKLNIDIVLLSETKIKPTLLIKFPNYHIYRTDNTPVRGSTANGGTAVLVHRRIVHRHIQLMTTLSSTTIEISCGNNLIRVSAVYKPPRPQMVNQDLDILTKHCDWFIVAGNLNAKHPAWNSQRTNLAGTILNRHMTQSDYTVIAPDSPTHFPGSPLHRPDVLDMALTKLPNKSLM